MVRGTSFPQGWATSRSTTPQAAPSAVPASPHNSRAHEPHRLHRPSAYTSRAYGAYGAGAWTTPGLPLPRPQDPGATTRVIEYLTPFSKLANEGTPVDPDSTVAADPTESTAKDPEDPDLLDPYAFPRRGDVERLGWQGYVPFTDTDGDALVFAINSHGFIDYYGGRQSCPCHPHLNTASLLAQPHSAPLRASRQ